MTIDHFYENIYTCKFDKFFFFLLIWERSSSFSYFVDHKKFWCSPNFSVQIAPDCILEHLNFQNFPGDHAPGPPSFFTGAIATILHIMMKRKVLELHFRLLDN